MSGVTLRHPSGRSATVPEGLAGYYAANGWKTVEREDSKRAIPKPRKSAAISDSKSAAK